MLLFSALRWIRVHRLNGYVTLILSAITVALSLYTHYIARMELDPLLWAAMMACVGGSTLILVLRADVPGIVRSLL